MILVASVLEPVITFFSWWGTQISNVWNSLYGVMFVGVGAWYLYMGWKRSGALDEKRIVGFDGAPHTAKAGTPIWVRVIYTIVIVLFGGLFAYALHLYLGLF
jgi:hypothetical protein